MANAVYPEYKEFLLSASANVSLDQNDTTNGPFCALVDTGTYTYNSAHDFYNDVTGVTTPIGTPVALASKTINSPSAGVFDAADTTLTSVTGASAEAILIFQDTGTASTSSLVAFIDGITVTPNGGNITIAWDNGASRIFAL